MPRRGERNQEGRAQLRPRFVRRTAAGGRVGPETWASLVALALLGLAVALSAGESPGERRLAALSPGEREFFRRQRERFEELDPAEQARLRALAAELASAPDAEPLRQTLRDYQAWLFETLSPGEIAELKRLPAATRVAQVARWERQRQPLVPAPLDPLDRAALAEWLSERIVARAAAKGSDKPRPNRRPPASEARRPAWLGALLQRAADGSLRGAFPQLEPADVEALAGRLSPAAARQLRECSPAQQRQLVLAWITEVIRDRLPEIPAAELARFFEQELSPKERDVFLALAPEEMDLRLRLRYLRAQRGGAARRPGRGPQERGPDAAG